MAMKNWKPWTDEQKAEALALLQTGLSYYKVGKITGLSDTNLAVKFPGYGRKPRRKGPHKPQFYMSPEKKAEVESLLEDGLSIAEVARAAKVNVNHLYAKYPDYTYTKTQVAKLANWSRTHNY